MPFDVQNAKCIEHRRKNGTISAIRVSAPMFPTPEWIPYWAVHEDSDVWKKDTSGTLLIKERFAVECGWL